MPKLTGGGDGRRVDVDDIVNLRGVAACHRHHNRPIACGEKLKDALIALS
jgi:hypothetical protein